MSLTEGVVSVCKLSVFTRKCLFIAVLGYQVCIDIFRQSSNEFEKLWTSVSWMPEVLLNFSKDHRHG